MTKGFKKFREEYEDDEWGDSDARNRKRKEKRLDDRKIKRKEKLKSRWEDTDENS